MKIHRSALGLVLLVSLSTAKIIPTSEPISTAAAAAAEKEILGPAEQEPAKREAPQDHAAIAVEAAEEPKQADRTKKSATTTFCVEIRPGPSDGPVKACDEHNPQAINLPPPPPAPVQADSHIPNVPNQEIHHEEPEQLPVFVIPSNPLAVYIPNEGQSFVNYPQHIIHHNNQVQVPGNSQHIIIPSNPWPSVPSSSSQQIIFPSVSYPSVTSTPQHIVVPSTTSGLCPCQSSTNGLQPHALISLFRSAMARNGAAAGDGDNMSPSAFMEPGMEMRSGNSGDWMSDMNSGSMLMGGMPAAPNQMPYGSEGSFDSPFGRTHTKKIYAVPIGSYYGSGAGGYQAKSPYVVQCNPQVLGLGGLNSPTFRDAEGNPDINNMENPGARNIEQSLQPTMNEAQMKLGTPQGGRHVIHPIVQPIIHTTPGATFHSSSPSVYQQHSSSYQTYQTRPMYPSHDSSYMVHPGSHFYRREGAPQQLRAWNNQPAANMQQRNPSSDMETQRQFEDKSWNPHNANMERASSGVSAQQPQQQQQQQGVHSGAMSPSQMLNHMRGIGSSSSGSSSFGRTSPVMQSFPREHEESPCKEGIHVNMHLPSGGQPFMITAPRNNRDEKNMEMKHGGAMHEEMGKRDAEKSTLTEIDA